MVVKSVEIDMSVSGDVESKAKLDAIDARAEALKEAFPTYALKVDSAAATAKLQIFRGEFKSVADAASRPMEMQVLSAKAVKTLEDIRLRADKLRATFPSFTAKIDDSEFKAKLAVMAAEAKATGDVIDKELSGAGGSSTGSKLLGLIPGVGGGSAGGSGAAGSAAGDASAGGGVLTNPYVLAGATAAALAALPFLAQAAAGAITLGLGGALAGLAIAGDLKVKSVVTSFDNLKTHASADLTDIGKSFVPVLNNILSNATTTLGKITPIFAGAEKTISGPFQVFSDALIKTFASPAVKTSIDAVATAFGKILTALSPSLAQDASAVASGITKVANAVAANPDAFRNFISFLADTVGGALTAIAGLTKFASYLESHFIPAFDTTRHAIAAVWGGIASDATTAWNKIWTQTYGRVIQGAHSVEAAYNTMKAALSTALGAVSSAATTAWNTIWNNTVTRVQNGITSVVNFFKGIPGKITSALGSAGSVLTSWGAGVINGLLSGMESVITSVWNFIKGIPGQILKFLGIKSPPDWAIEAGKQIMNGLGIGMAQAQGVFQKASAASAAAAAKAVTGGGAVGSGGVSNASGVAALKSAAAKHGWTSAAEWAALNNVEMREAGYSLTATNPTSGAYGMAQFINGASEYAQYGGNSTTYAGQATAMTNYIASRYGDPIAAWAHEQAFGWYDRGGWLPTGLSLAMNTTGRPEMVGGDALVAEMRALRAEVRSLTGVAAAIPARTGQHVGGVINGAGADASFRRRYP